MNDSRNYILRANQLLELERWPEAIKELLRARSSDPENPHTSCLLAQANLGLGEFQSALKYANEAIALDPEEEWGHRLRCVALGSLGKKKEALTSALEAARLDPEDSFVLSTLVEAQLACGKVKEAGSTAQKLRELYPELELSHFTYGNYCLKLGDHRSAERSFEKAIEINPLSSDARNNLAVAISMRGESSSSKTGSPAGLSILETAGEVEVHRHFGEAIKLDPMSETAQKNFQHQFRYAFALYLALALLPFGILIFVVTPGWTVIWSIFFLISVLNVVRSVRRSRRELAEDLKPILANVSNLSVKQRLKEFVVFAGRFYRKTWPAFALAVLAVIVRFIDFGEASRNSGSKVFASLIVVGALVWLGRLMGRNDD